MIYIYTDGSCSKNPGPGGFSVIAILNDNTICYAHSESCSNTTNNREELKAIISAIEYTNSLPDQNFIIYTDSSYAEQSINNWMYKWYNNNWQNSKKQTVENLDLIQTLYKYCTINSPNFQIKKIKGHNGNVGNELADAAATKNEAKIRKIFKENKLNYLP